MSWNNKREEDNGDIRGEKKAIVGVTIRCLATKINVRSQVEPNKSPPDVSASLFFSFNTCQDFRKAVWLFFSLLPQKDRLGDDLLRIALFLDVITQGCK